MFIAGSFGHEFFAYREAAIHRFPFIKDQRLTPFKGNQQIKLPPGLLAPPPMGPVKPHLNTSEWGQKQTQHTSHLCLASLQHGHCNDT